MSYKTTRKRLSLTLVAALVAGVLTSVSTGTVANAHGGVVSTSVSNAAATTGTVNANLFVAEKQSATGIAQAGRLDSQANDTTTTGDGQSIHQAALSRGLLAKDTSTGINQTATVLTSGALSLYSWVSTDVAFTTTGGTFSTTATTGVSANATFSQNRQTAFHDVGNATAVAQVWDVPSTAGTYTIAMYVGGGTEGTTLSVTSPTVGTLAGRITVTVVAASSGGSYSAIYSVCNADSLSAQPSRLGNNVDDSSSVDNGGAWYIGFALNDAYAADLDNGNIVVTATNGALVNYAETSTAAAGTASTDVTYENASTFGSVTVTQGTANAPVTTTVTISYNGTTTCTKTVTIRGEVASIAVTDIATQDLSTTTGSLTWIDDVDATGRSGLFKVTTKDSAGNVVKNSSGFGTWSSVAASLAGQTVVTGLSVDNPATSTSSTSGWSYGTGIYSCGATAGSLPTAKLQFTNSGSGTIVTSGNIALRCADDAATVSASWDKASYKQGELATLTLKFTDSKGNPANNVGSTGTWTALAPMMTNISATGAALTLTNTGTATVSFSVGISTGITAGTYTSIVDFTSLIAAGTATRQTGTYAVSTGGDTTTNADVLKSIVALIASINKQIQALQKLILKR
jgi:hypothetical protein